MYHGITIVGNNTFDIQRCVNVRCINPSRNVGKFSPTSHSLSLYFSKQFMGIILVRSASISNANIE